MELEYSLINSQTTGISTSIELSQDIQYTKQKLSPILSDFKDDTIKEHVYDTIDSFTLNKANKKPIFNIVRDYAQANKNEVKTTSKLFLNYSRKEKSLGELSKKFLIMFGKIDECMILLDKVTKQLGVERRRIYDIINILESLGVVHRKGKNNYQWKGLKSIYKTIQTIQKSNDTKFLEESPKASFENQIEDSSDEDDDSNKDNLSHKKEKSLGLLSNGFIKLFFLWKKTITLEQAARKLSSNISENKLKTKIRRLYDIANVFNALGLIKKTCLDSKKPAFMWVGLDGLNGFINRLNESKEVNMDIFQENYVNKKKDVKAMEQLHDLEDKIKPIMRIKKIQSKNSAFKSHENVQTKPKNDYKLFENPFLNNFMNFCKQQFMLHNSNNNNHSNANVNITNMNCFESKRNESYETNTIYQKNKYPENFTCQLNSSINIENIQKNISSPPKILENCDYATPNIRKTISIIKLDKTDGELTPEKNSGFRERGNINQNYNILGDKTNLVDKLKRTNCYSIGEFDLRTAKKVHPNYENPNLGDFSLKYMNIRRSINHAISNTLNDFYYNNQIMNKKT